MHRVSWATSRQEPSAPHLLCIAWAPYAPRSQRLAAALGAEIHTVHFLAFQRPLVAPLKYLLQALVTTSLLWRKHPRVVIVQNPPIFAGMLVALYACLTRNHYIIDSHTGALVGSKWQWSIPLHRWLSRHALATIVTNASLRERIVGGKQRSFRVLIVEDPPAEWSSVSPAPSQARAARQVVVIATYDSDEPIAAVLEAARHLPEVSFAITGDVHRLQPMLCAACPPNVRLTGWLNDADYGALLRAARVLVALTTRDHTTLCGAWEALYAGQPLVTSDWPVLRGAFPQGAVFTGASAHEITAAIHLALAQEDSLRAAMQTLAARKRQTWATSIVQLRQLIPEGEAG